MDGGIINIEEQQARADFSASVANVAFTLVLTKSMVEGLRTIRDGGGNFIWAARLNGLRWRGLVVINDKHRARLSISGTLCVQLLEQAGLMEPQ